MRSIRLRPARTENRLAPALSRRAGRASCGALVLSALLTATGPTSAQATPSSGPQSEGEPEPRAVEQAEARRLYEAGLEAFRAGNYQAAIVKFRESHGLSRAPLLLYNLAQAHRLYGDCAAALALYREFLSQNPGGKARELAEARVSELASCEAAPKPSSEADAHASSAKPPSAAAPAGGSPAHRRAQLAASLSTPTPRQRRAAAERSHRASETQRTLAFVSFGSAATLLGLSGYFAWRADRAAADVSSVFAERGTWSPALSERERDGKRSATLGVVSLIAGLAAAGTGTFLWTFD